MPIITEAHITRCSLKDAVGGTSCLERHFSLASGKYHTNKNCAYINPSNATTGVVSFPLCAVCARHSEELIITVVLEELAKTAAFGRWRVKELIRQKTRHPPEIM